MSVNTLRESLTLLMLAVAVAILVRSSPVIGQVQLPDNCVEAYIDAPGYWYYQCVIPSEDVEEWPEYVPAHAVRFSHCADYEADSIQACWTVYRWRLDETFGPPPPWVRSWVGKYKWYLPLTVR